MLIDGKIYKIFGNIDAVSPNGKGPLNIGTSGNVVVGDNTRNRIFFANEHGPNIFSFQQVNTDLFIGFDNVGGSKILKVALTEVKWKVFEIENPEVYEVFNITGSENSYWEMNSNVLDSAIRVSPAQPAPRPPKQKWKFVRVKTVDLTGYS